ncbi:hypothetical protein ACGFSB_18610 [Streptomyces sp. NPDC048441]|uniref:hypothetical protein n=1 Tax=Streptomyces sp. NPDC048441 TaxID=3365552 RepID=UPI0037239D9A
MSESSTSESSTSESGMRGGRWRTAAALAAFAITASAFAAAPAQAAPPAPVGSFSYTGNADDAVAPNSSGSLTSPTSSFTLNGTNRYLTFTATGGGEHWEVRLEPEDGQDMVVGQTYVDSLDSDSAFVDVSGNGRGCYDSYAAIGAFTVTELKTDRRTGAVTDFAATYEQSCVDGPMTLRGSVSYSS